MARPALEALLEHVIDYAGLFPPASLPLNEALENYGKYRAGSFGWMLGRFVVDERRIHQIPPELDAHLAVLAEHDHPRAAAIESRTIVKASKPVYREVGIEQFDAVSETGCFAKVRTGGVTPDAIPDAETLTEFIHECARRRLPFKATAGLHHPIRSVQRLTDKPDSVRALTHGFVNVLLAAALAWRGADRLAVQCLLEEADPAAFRIENDAQWHSECLRREDIISARQNFMHSFGSCSFNDPVNDLKRLAWL
ncbi:MAG: hypothetical protein ACJ746_20370 [Bryobacteraceae bacterium]